MESEKNVERPPRSLESETEKCSRDTELDLGIALLASVLGKEQKEQQKGSGMHILQINASVYISKTVSWERSLVGGET